ncbi:MAG: hypothetical protein CVU29_11960 [Betaproteobacteria bacterium HGW-Betaproteobacteria-22]|nr:MAG: hypothetical protein CVU29_11960 [Betaproteobacteria bacterium HGW-Betaproteobacteria-22]
MAAGSDPASGMLIRSGMSALLGINENQLEMAMNVPVLQIPSDQVSKNFTDSFDRAYVGGTLTGAAYIAAPYIPTKVIVGIGAASGGGFDAATQYKNQWGQVFHCYILPATITLWHAR